MERQKNLSIQKTAMACAVAAMFGVASAYAAPESAGAGVAVTTPESAAASQMPPSAPSLQPSPTPAPIQTIILSSGGLAEIFRSAQVGSGQSLVLDVPLDQVNDILKSLVVRDPSGGVGAIRLDGLSPVHETFSRLPFSPEQLRSMPKLLQTLQGVHVRVSSGGRSVEGAVLGVDEQWGHAESDADMRSAPVLSVMTEEGHIEVLKLGTEAVLDIKDPAMRERVERAVDASSRLLGEDMRRIAIKLESDEAREVGLSYSIPAPVWKTAYRLMMGSQSKARLQAWAVLENATGEDWEDVAVTLSSGAPVTLAQQLFQRYWHTRQEVPVIAQSTAAPRPDDEAAFSRDDQPMQESGSAVRAMASAPGPVLKRARAGSGVLAAPSRAANEAVAAEGDISAQYRLPEPISLAAGQTYSSPFIDVQADAERVSVFDPDRDTVHPVAAVFLKNTTQASLPPGILTVYDEDQGYVGDAQLSGIPKGDSRMAKFASDRKVTVISETTPEEETGQISITDGVLHATRVARMITTYSVTGAEDGPRTMIIEHPRREGWQFSSDALDSSTASSHRLRLSLKAGASASAKAVDEQKRGETFALVDAGQQALLHWSGMADDADTAERLKKLAHMRGAVAEVESALQKLEADTQRAVDNQARIRANMASVPDQSALGQRYVFMLEQEEDLIAELDKKTQETRKQLVQRQQDMSALIRMSDSGRS
ncbi:DUF4139 domain-containing protein [Allopusillimonas ginsengisoli]|uniref:DUF4139 domain-containing protein n=1 Tax=Allopusillimonas ginsengisoli TaxID=453575 RepID=UPI0014853446